MQIDQKTEKLMLFALTITFIAAYIETDIYVPSFPAMLKYFATDEKTLQLIVSGNFAGIFFGCLASGPISDRFGRRTPMLLSLIGFVIASLGCAISGTIYQLIGWRFIQGFFVSIPMAIPCAVIMDKYDATKAAKLIAFLSSIVTGTMVFAPAVGGWLQITYGWQSTFIFITIFAVIALLANFLFLEESLTLDKRIQLSLSNIFRDYFTIIRNQQFMCNTAIMSLMYAAFLIYMSNLSLIFINHIHVPETTYIFYQSTTMAAYVVGSLIATKTIGLLGLIRARNLGSLIGVLGVMLMIIAAFFMSTKPMIITLSFAVISIGCALAMGVYFVNALEPFPEMNGKAMSMCVSLRQLFTSAIIVASSLFFNGTIMPVSISVVILALICTLFFLRIRKIQKLKEELPI